jgi:hypothetical protein
VTPIMTGIICSNRRMMYLPTPTPLVKGSPRASWTKHSVGPPRPLRRADALGGVSQACLHFTLIASKSRTPKALIFTSVTFSDQTAVVFGYHSGAVGKSVASNASAC